MSVARKVLMIIASILSIGAVITFAICAVAFFVSINNEEVLTRVLDGLGKKNISLEDGKTIVTILGVLFAILAFFALINACLSIKGVKSNRTGLMVINIIFGFIAGIYVNSLGAIFGLVDSKKE